MGSVSLSGLILGIPWYLTDSNTGAGMNYSLGANPAATCFCNRILFTESHSCRYLSYVVHNGKTEELQNAHLLCKKKLYSQVLGQDTVHSTLVITDYFVMHVFFNQLYFLIL